MNSIFVGYQELSRSLRLKLLTLGVGDSLLLPLFSFSGIDVNGSKRLSPTPSVSNLSLRPCRYLSTVSGVQAEPQSMASDGKGCRDLRPLIRSRCKGILKQDNEWRGELLCVT